MHRTPLAIILAQISIGGNINAFSTPQYHTRTQQPQLQLSTSTLFAGGGFGATSTSKSSTAPSKKKKGKKSKSSSLLDLEVSTPAKEEETAGPKLDRFGLPVPTEDDVFPPLSPDIKRIPADNVDEFNQDDVAEAIKNHLGVNLNVFDKDGYSTHEEEEGNKWKLKLLHNDPPVFQIDNFFTEDECQSYMSMVDPQSKHDDQQQQSNAVQMTSPTFSSLSISRRTSTTWFCRYKSVTTLLAKAQQLLNNVKLNQFEEPQVVRYRTGEEFSWHYDEIPKTQQLSNGGQRLATLLVYLNDLEEDRGGGTVFRDLTPPTTTAAAAGGSSSDKNKGKKSKRSKGNNTTSNNNDSNNNKQHLTVRPRTGTALLFFPSYTDGTPDQRTLHKGEVALDTKMIAQLWIHENEYQAGVPEGNLQSDAVDGVEREAARLGFI